MIFGLLMVLEQWITSLSSGLLERHSRDPSKLKVCFWFLLTVRFGVLLFQRRIVIRGIL